MCHGFQNTDLRDRNGRKVYLFNDGSLKLLEGSEKLQSRFEIDFLNSNLVRIKNIFGKHLSSQRMEWTDNNDNGSLSLEYGQGFASFKSIDDGYLTVTKENELSFTSNLSSDEQFLLDEQCSISNTFF